MAFFQMSFDGLPVLEKRLRKVRFQVKKIIAESMKEVGEDVLIPRVQEAIIEGDYLFKANSNEDPNLLDSITVTVQQKGREIVVSVGSTTNYAKFFEEGRPAGQFPSGKEYELRNITRWLIEKKAVDPAKAPGIAATMIQTLEDEEDALRFPDPVIGPAAKEAEDEYTRDLAALVQLRVEELR